MNLFDANPLVTLLPEVFTFKLLGRNNNIIHNLGDFVRSVEVEWMPVSTSMNSPHSPGGAFVLLILTDTVTSTVNAHFCAQGSVSRRKWIFGKFGLFLISKTLIPNFSSPGGSMQICQLANFIHIFIITTVLFANVCLRWGLNCQWRCLAIFIID